MGAVEDRVLEAFTHGRGVPYSAYARFHEVMAEESSHTVLAGLDAHILPLDPDLIPRLKDGIDVLDIACGRGRAMIHLAAQYPASRFTGIDLAPEAIAWAEAEVRRRRLTNITFQVADLADGLPAARYDVVTAFDAIHDQARPMDVLRAIRLTLRPGGLYLMQDIVSSSHLHCNRTHPIGPFLYAISCFHCMSVSLSRGGPGLGAMWGTETALEMLAAAGFRDVRVENLEHDIMNCYYVCRIDAE